MINERTIRDRLKDLRAKSGLSEADVASRLGKSGNSYINRIENGPTKLNIEILQELSAFYKINPLDLLQEQQQLSVSKNTSKGFFEKSVFRGTEAIEENIRAQIKEHLPTLNKIGKIQKILGKEPVKLIDISSDFENINLKSPFAAQAKAKDAAKLIRNFFKLDQNASIDVSTFCWNYLNIPICGLNLGDNCWGMYSSDKNGNPLIIYSNSHVFTQRNVFTVAHEIGHYLFAHDYLNVDCDTEEHTVIEKIANTFAQELLVPSDVLRQVYDELGFSSLSQIKPHHVVTLCDHFKVSFFMMIVCLSQTKKITATNSDELKDFCVNQLRSASEDLGYYPDKYFSHHKSLHQQLRELVLIALRRKLISFFEASQVLDEPTAELKAAL